MNVAHKIPQSVLVVIHTPALEVLLLERADHPGFWQSVTGSLDAPHEALQRAIALHSHRLHPEGYAGRGLLRRVLNWFAYGCVRFGAIALAGGRDY